MVNEIHGILSNERPLAQRGEESFLRDVIAPIYEVIRKVAIMLLHCCSFHFPPCKYTDLLIVFVRWKRKQGEIKVAKQVIQHGETMMI